ncbi:MAG: protein kinase [Hormoscilla sp.]
MPNTSPGPIAKGTIIENRYQVLRQLGRGGFGRTYLVEDMNRYKERCVIKEFAPQLKSSTELQKAERLFKREASMLYKLEHPQIPRFRELFQTKIDDQDFLFLVQDYVKGKTYAQLLKGRKAKPLSEEEVTQLLLDILPVLSYIHSQKVLHRDISPDNLILRTGDKLPVLIDFGCVKHVAARAVSQSKGLAGTLVGKPGYCPEEQLRDGMVSPSSDLYALAVTLLVLITGKQPQELYDSTNATWNWEQMVTVGPTLKKLLNKMLAHKPRDRYQSAKTVHRILEKANSSGVGNMISTMNTIVVGHIQKVNHQISGLKKSSMQLAMWQIVAITVSISLVGGIGATLAFSAFRKPQNYPASAMHPASPVSFSAPASFASSGFLSKTEKKEQLSIHQRCQNLKIDPSLFYQQVDNLFYGQYPELKGRQLTEKPADAQLRSQWYQLADELLDRLEKGESLWE